MTASRQQSQGSAPGKASLVVVAATNADNVNFIVPTSADDFEEIQFTVEAFVLFQADNEGDVAKKARCLAYFVFQRFMDTLALFS